MLLTNKDILYTSSVTGAGSPSWHMWRNLMLKNSVNSLNSSRLTDSQELKKQPNMFDWIKRGLMYWNNESNTNLKYLSWVHGCCRCCWRFQGILALLYLFFFVFFFCQRRRWKKFLGVSSLRRRSSWGLLFLFAPLKWFQTCFKGECFTQVSSVDFSLNWLGGRWCRCSSFSSSRPPAKLEFHNLLDVCNLPGCSCSAAEPRLSNIEETVLSLGDGTRSGLIYLG